MVARCPRCGARAPEQADRCPRCAHHLAADVVVLEPDVAVGDVSSPSSRHRGPGRAVVVVVAVLAAGILVLGGGTPSVPEPGPPPVTGEPLPALDDPTGVRLLVAVAGDLWELDVDRRRAVPVPLPPGAMASVVERPGAAVVVVGGRAVLVRRADSVAELGRAEEAFASEGPDRVWLRTGGSVREVSLADGATTAGPVAVAAHGAAGGGLVVRDLEGASLVDVRTGETVRRFRDPLILGVAGPWLVAGDRDDFQCSIVPVGLATGARRRGPVLPYRSCFFGRAVLSADGTRLGLPLSESIDRRDGRSYGALFVVDVVRSSAVEIPRTRRQAMPYRSLAWTPSGRWLFWIDHTAPYRIAAYRVGTSSAVALDTTAVPAGPIEGLWAID